MKKLFFNVLLITAMILGFTSCNHEEEKYLSVDKTSVHFDANGQYDSGTFCNLSISTNIDNLDALSISSSASWCTFARTGYNISVYAEKNTSTSSRNATITVSGAGLQATINVSQSAGSGGGGGGGGELSAPTGVTAKQNGNAISISWNNVSGATSYSVYWASTSSNPTHYVVQNINNTSFVDNEPVEGANYYWIKAFNNTSESNYSSYAYCNYSSGGGGGGTTKPNAPTGVTVSNEGSASFPMVVVRWNSVSGATSYKVYRSSSASGTYSQIGSATSYTSLTDNSPLSGGNYYKVKAVNSAGESDFSSYAYYSNSGVTYSPCPVTYGNCTVSGTTITMRWTNPTTTGCGTPTSTLLRVKNANNDNYVTVQTLSGTATSASFNCFQYITPSGLVYVGIVTENSAGSSGGVPKVYNTNTGQWVN